MPKFITLVDWKTDRDVRINPEHIQMLRRTSPDDGEHRTVVYLLGVEPLWAFP